MSFKIGMYRDHLLAFIPFLVFMWVQVSSIKQTGNFLNTIRRSGLILMSGYKHGAQIMLNRNVRSHDKDIT